MCGMPAFCSFFWLEQSTRVLEAAARIRGRRHACVYSATESPSWINLVIGIATHIYVSNLAMLQHSRGESLRTVDKHSRCCATGCRNAHQSRLNPTNTHHMSLHQIEGYPLPYVPARQRHAATANIDFHRAAPLCWISALLTHTLRQSSHV